MGVACSKHDATVNTPPHHPQQSNPYNDQLVSSTTPRNNNGGGLFSSCMSSCSGMDPAVDPRMDSCRADAIDPVMYDLCKKSLNMTLHDQEETKKKERLQESAPLPPSHQSSSSCMMPQSSSSTNKQKQRQQQQQPPQQRRQHVGQYHLLYKHQTRSGASSALIASSTNHHTPVHQSSSLQSSQQVVDYASMDNSLDDISTVPTTSPYSTRLIVRRRPIVAAEEGTHGTHLYAVRYPPDDVAPTNKMMSGTPSEPTRLQEQAPSKAKERKKRGSDPAEPLPEPPRPSPTTAAGHLPLLPTEGLTDFFQPARMKQPKTARPTSK
jgi:hypothetical protein